MKRPLFFLIAVLAATTLMTGCATLFGPSARPLTVTSKPAGAEVYVDGLLKGTTPVELTLKADKSYTIEFRKEGYDAVSHTISGAPGGTRILQVIYK